MPQTPLASSNEPADDGAISPALRRRLQQCYEHGLHLMEQANCDHDYVHSSLVECVVRDPGNLVYLEAFLDNLQRKFKNSKRGALLRFGGKGALKKAVASQDWAAVFRYGAERLKSNPWDIATLRSMANACEALGHGETELRYLKNALAPDPNNVDVNRHCAQSLARLGQFDQAIACWHRVDEVKKGDREAQEMISQLQFEKMGGKPKGDRKAKQPAPEPAPAAEEPAAPREIPRTRRQELETMISINPTDMESYTELSQLHIDEGRFGEAVHLLKKAVSASGADFRAQQRLEDVEILWKQNQLAVAQQRAADGSDGAAKRLVRQLQDELNRYELEVFHARADRFPEDVEARYQLGVRLKQAENFREAIHCFTATQEDADRQAASLLALGECLQHTKQYEKALENYLAATRAAEECGQSDVLKLSRYRTGVLATALNNNDTAEEHLAALVALDPGFKDASSRLDKLREIGHKG